VLVRGVCLAALINAGLLVMDAPVLALLLAPGEAIVDNCYGARAAAVGCSA
jgi:hypothetical protein